VRAMLHEDHVRFLTVEIDAFVAALRGAELSTPVPSCPGWDLAELIRHQGRVHRWAEWHVSRLAAERHDTAEIGIEFPPDADLVEWLAEGGALLVQTLGACDPDAPMWAWGADHHARFWSRRQLHETAVHRADAELALGKIPTIVPEIAVDAINELLDNLPHAAYFSPNVAELRGSGESIHLHCTDTDGEWMVTLEPDGFRYDHAHGKGSVAVRGSAADLLLLSYNRLTRDDARFEVFGDAALLDRWLHNAAL